MTVIKEQLYANQITAQTIPGVHRTQKHREAEKATMWPSMPPGKEAMPPKRLPTHHSETEKSQNEPIPPDD